MCNPNLRRSFFRLLQVKNPYFRIIFLFLSFNIIILRDSALLIASLFPFIPPNTITTLEKKNNMIIVWRKKRRKDGSNNFIKNNRKRKKDSRFNNGISNCFFASTHSFQNKRNKFHKKLRGGNKKKKIRQFKSRYSKNKNWRRGKRKNFKNQNFTTMIQGTNRLNSQSNIFYSKNRKNN